MHNPLKNTSKEMYEKMSGSLPYRKPFECKAELGEHSLDGLPTRRRKYLSISQTDKKRNRLFPEKPLGAV